ncbi:aldehyde dehydrogenase family protein [Streptomyces boluensis]|uniref:aldehyde dehydrogenase family protein n=1 Tax=Streptomyces boluensis TaxID=1775135 RepID=UPI0028ADA305|nr:aldehyde dehydrogenase family protein [Streptomyces boluensis]
MTDLQETNRGTSVGHFRMFIGGEWVDADEHFEIRSPATEELLATVARGDVAHADRAVAAANSAHQEGTWRLTPPAQRAAVLRKVADRFAERSVELTELHAREIGATIRLAEPMHFGAALPHMQYLADLTDRYEFEQGGARWSARCSPRAECGANRSGSARRSCRGTSRCPWPSGRSSRRSARATRSSSSRTSTHR